LGLRAALKLARYESVNDKCVRRRTGWREVETVGIAVLLINERGDVLDEISDPANHLHRFLPRAEAPVYVLVNYVDWYGDTIFNRLQMPRFRDEWATLRDVAETAGAAHLHSKVASMAERCGREVHTYLKFLGD
jgi:hypothetical protein